VLLDEINILTIWLLLSFASCSLREERLQRITRYRSRLRLLLPPAIEQCRNDTAAGN